MLEYFAGVGFKSNQDLICVLEPLSSELPEQDPVLLSCFPIQ